MSLIPELLDPKARGYTQMETQSWLLLPWFPEPGLFLAVLHLSRSLPNCLQGIANHRPMGLEDTSF